MTSFHLRPRFSSHSPLSITQLCQDFQAYLDRADATCKGKVLEDWIWLSIPPVDQHFWSPILMLSLEEASEGTLIKGKYGPRAQVWTLFRLGYLVLSFSALFISIIGGANLSLDKPAPILWLLPLLALLAIGLYVVGQMGQKLAAEQTFQLHFVVQEVLDSPIHLH
ncbi:MAG: hypothetical protein AAFR61_00450 [Bacteroidota bacterium]